jgi:hypothetical protein
MTDDSLQMTAGRKLTGSRRYKRQLLGQDKAACPMKFIKIPSTRPQITNKYEYPKFKIQNR